MSSSIYKNILVRPMKIKVSLLLLLFMYVAAGLKAQKPPFSNSVLHNVVQSRNVSEELASNHPIVIVTQQDDTLSIAMSISDSQQQLTLLMQGMTIGVQTVSDTLTICFPDASVVRDRLRRHPNEVKPSFADKQNTLEVRPDILPLVRALSEVSIMAHLTGSDGHRCEYHSTNGNNDGNESAKNTNIISLPCHYCIDMSRESGMLSYTFAFPQTKLKDDHAIVTVISSPLDNLPQEFNGTSRTEDSVSPPRKGLGNRPSRDDVFERTYQYSTTVALE